MRIYASSNDILRCFSRYFEVHLMLEPPAAESIHLSLWCVEVCNPDRQIGVLAVFKRDIWVCIFATK